MANLCKVKRDVQSCVSFKAHKIFIGKCTHSRVRVHVCVCVTLDGIEPTLSFAAIFIVPLVELVQLAELDEFNKLVQIDNFKGVRAQFEFKERGRERESRVLIAVN